MRNENRRVEPDVFHARVSPDALHSKVNPAFLISHFSCEASAVLRD